MHRIQEILIRDRLKFRLGLSKINVFGEKVSKLIDRTMYIHTSMTRVPFLLLVGLWLRAFGAQPPSEKYISVAPKEAIGRYYNRLKKKHRLGASCPPK